MLIYYYKNRVTKLIMKRNVLLINLGSPKSLKIKDVKSYLNEFLSDDLVVDLPKPIQQFILRSFILPFRPKKTKVAYEKIWSKNGSPLIYNTNKITGSKGSSLETQGWIWDFEPNPDDNSRESGKIVFEIIVDYYGEIEGLKILETTLSPKVENIYKEEILKLTFSPTNNNNPAEISKGKITFIIKNN